MARTEQEILKRIKEKEIHVAELKGKLDGVKVGHRSGTKLVQVQVFRGLSLRWC